MAKKKKSKSTSVSEVFERAQSLLRERKPMTNRNPFVIMPEGSYKLHVYADPNNPAFFRFRIQHKITLGGQTLKLISPRLTREMNAEIEDIGYDESPLDDRIEELMAGSREDQALAKKIKVTEFVVFYGRIEWDEPPKNSDDPTEGLIMCTMSDFGKIIRAAMDDMGEAELEPDSKFVFQIEREGWDIETVTCLDIEDMMDSEVAFVENSPPLKDRVAPLPLDELKSKLDEASKGKAQRARRRARPGREETEDEEDEESDRVASPSRRRQNAKRKQEVEDDDDEEEDDEDLDDDDDDEEEEEERPTRRSAKRSPASKRSKGKTGKRDIASELLDDLEDD